MSWAADGQDGYGVQQIRVNFCKFIALRREKLAKSRIMVNSGFENSLLIL